METSISLRTVFPQSRFFGGEDVLGSRVVCDPGQCEPGAVLAILADCEDPTAAACQALARGASGILTEQILPVPLPQCVVANADRAAVQLSAKLLDDPAQDLLVVGVAGGDGKSTTALLISALLRGEGQRTAYDTDLGSSDGIMQTVPDSRARHGLDVLRMLAEARDCGCAAAVVELSPELIRTAAFRGLPIDVLVLTGGGDSSSSDFPDRDLDVALEQLRDGGVALVNADSPAAVAAADRAAVPTLTYGMRGDANIAGKIFDQQPGETTLMVTAGDVTATLETALTGPAHAASHLAALSVGMLIQAPLHRAIASLSQLRSVPGRLQRFFSSDAPSVVLDRGGNGRRLRTVLRGLRRERGNGKLWVVAAIPTELAGEEIAACGRIAEKYADVAVVTAAEGGKSTFLSSVHDWLDGVQKAAGPRLIADRETAVRWAIDQASASDTVLVVGGWATESPAMERAALQCEAERIESCLEARAETRPTPEPKILPHPALES